MKCRRRCYLRKGQRAAALQLLQKAAAKWREHFTGRPPAEKHQSTDFARATHAACCARRNGLARNPRPWRRDTAKCFAFLLGALVRGLQSRGAGIGEAGDRIKARGFVIVAPTRRYGYTADNDNASAGRRNSVYHEGLRPLLCGSAYRRRAGGSREFPDAMASARRLRLS